MSRKRKTSVNEEFRSPSKKKQTTSQPALEQYKPSKQWIAACSTVVNSINQTLRQSLGSSWSVLPQGSYVQGLQLLGSDLDLVLLDGSDSWRHMNKRRTADELDRVVSLLCRRAQQFGSIRINVIQKIYRARVPLARMTATLLSGQRPYQIELDMCFGDPSRGLCDQYVNRTISRSQDLENFCLGLKIFFKKRGMTETHSGGISSFAIVLLGIYFYTQNGGVDFLKFFQWFITLRTKMAHSVSVEMQSLVPRPSDSYDCLLHVAVPCKPMENAARCLTMTVWNRLVFPELARAVEVVKSIPDQRRLDFDHVVRELLNSTVRAGGRKVSHHFEYSSSSESESEGSEKLEAPEWSDDDDTVEEYDQRSRIDVVELDSDSDDDELVVKKPIVIHECADCDYSSYNHDEFLNHRFVTHRPENDRQEPDVERFKLPKNFNAKGHMYAASPPPAPKYKRKRPDNTDFFL